MLAKGSFWSRMVSRFWVKSVVVPQNPLIELKLDLSRPIVYVLDQNSANDLLALQKACREHALPDPYLPLQVHDTTLSAVIYLHDGYLFTKKPLQQEQSTYLQQYQQLSDLHLKYADLDVQLVPVTFFWGRNPGVQNPRQAFSGNSNVSFFQKSWSILTAGNDHLIRFNAPISVKMLLGKNNDSTQQAYKLARVALHYFSTQHRSSRGPQIPNRKKMIKQVVASEKMQQIIKQQSIESGESEAVIRKKSHAYLEEISSNFSYRFLRVFRFILSKVWNGIYQGIEVNHAQAVRDATQSGAEIIYMPCHRSHMDYLLLSYLLYGEGLVPPHVAAGVNLNFFPAGGIFRRSGAFFLRRSFKDNPLYGKVFKAYFAMLFKQGYPIEFFTEGGRSRTGRLLPAKTGLLAMSVQTFLDQPERNVMIVPVYIGYDHIMEVSTYMKELSGQKKEKESAWQVLGIFKKLQNFGRAFVNFGEPINLKQYFDQQQPNWRDQALSEQAFQLQVNHLANNVMQGINQVTAVNALPLCAAILLASANYQLGKQRMLSLLQLHQQLLAQMSESTGITYPKQSPELIYQQALAMNKFSESNHVVSCDHQQSTYLTYYRNTVVHVFALPSLLSYALIKLNNESSEDTEINVIQVIDLITKLLGFVEAEYFLKDSSEVLKKRVLDLLVEFKAANLITFDGNILSLSNTSLLQVLSDHLSETRLRYHCVLSSLSENVTQTDETLILATKNKLTGKSIEPFDEKVIKVFIKQLDRHNLTLPQIEELLTCLSAKE
ncbi:glycerol-3-phosphate 1-O-acyltransferase PlsB [Psychromonas arctica]|uniref:Glycerol-3-phosphate acyltransferase n=1 Tax=Psychromonas arctica TaxID=168275 RepID=A0ABU9H6Z8_9GAMM